MGKHSDRGLRRGQGYTERRVARDGTVSYVARWHEGGKLKAKTFRAEGIPPTAAAERDALEAAEDHVRTMDRAVRSGRYIPPARMTVMDLVNAYLERNESKWKPNTYATYADRARSCIEHQIGSIRVRDLDPVRVQHWVSHLDASPRSVAGAVAILSGALKEAVRLRIVEISPVTGVTMPRVERVEHTTWTTAQCARILATVSNDPMYHALYRLALVSGMRPGELMRLTWDDLDLDRVDRHGLPASVVTVRHSMTKDRNGRVVPGTDTKTGERRTVAIPPSAAEALRTWRTAQKRIRLATDGWEDRGAVFTGRRGQHLAHATWYNHNRRTCMAAGVPVITLHELRHTNATSEMESGTNPKVVSDRLGHSKTQITLDLYSHVSAELHRAATEALEQRLDAALANTTTSGGKPAKSG